MVSVKLQGGLGNNMFQIAAAIGLAKKKGDNYCIPENKYFPNLPKGKEGAVTACVYSEPRFEYADISESKCNYFLLQGYFQSEKYFSHCKEEVIKAFNINPIIREGWVAFHYRLGDYRTKPNYHPIISEEYISSALAFFAAKGYGKFMVFSDEIEYCKEFLSKYNLLQFEYSEGKSALEDMALGAGCSHQVCSNSTFSWWQAYLNPNPNKMVLVPKIWFGKECNHNTKDLIPENWIQL